MTRPSILLLLLAAVVPAVACESNDTGLRQTSVTSSCANGTRCTSSPWDAPMAVGTFLDLDIQSQLNVGGAGAPPTLVTPVDDTIITADGPRLNAHAPGLTALLVQTPDGVVMDFFHVWVGLPTLLRLIPRNPDGTAEDALDQVLTMRAGDSLLLDVVPISSAQALNGRFPVLVASDPAVATGAQLPGLNRIVLDALHEGETDVSVTGLSLTTTFHLTVLP